MITPNRASVLTTLLVLTHTRVVRPPLSILYVDSSLARGHRLGNDMNSKVRDRDSCLKDEDLKFVWNLVYLYLKQNTSSQATSKLCNVKEVIVTVEEI
jgi:hypothetical protein